MYRVPSGLHKVYVQGAKWSTLGVCTGCKVVYIRCMYRVHGDLHKVYVQGAKWSI